MGECVFGRSIRCVFIWILILGVYGVCLRRLAGFRQAVTSSLARIDDRSARKTLFLVLDTSGQKHDRGSKRERDVRPTHFVYVERCVTDGWSDVGLLGVHVWQDAPRPWQLKRKS